MGNLVNLRRIFEEPFYASHSIMNRLTIIQECINQKQLSNYVEIGVSTGWLFFKVKSKFKIGIDPNFNFPWYNQIRRYFPNIKCFEVTSDEFFAKKSQILKKTGGIDIAFVDGLHTYEQAYRDVVNCLPNLNDGGIIFLHDCNPPNKACGWPAKNIAEYRHLASSGQIPGYLNSWNGDVWKAIVRLRSQHPDLIVGTLDVDWGIGFVYKGSSSDQLPYKNSDIDNMTYEDFEKNRQLLLGLQPPLYLHKIIEHSNPKK